MDIYAARGWEFIHYRDDFQIVGDPGSSECSVALNVALELCGRLGVPIAEQKLQGPTTSLSFLGIELDTMAMELRLPQEKLGQLKVMIQDWKARKSCSKRELLSLIGRLRVKWCGREGQVVKLRDSASATALRFPGTCTSLIVKLLQAATQNNSRSSPMRERSRDERPDHACTTAWLSQWKVTRLLQSF